MAGLVLGSTALVSSFTGAADAARSAIRDAVSTPKPGAVLKLGKNGKFPARAIPKVSAATNADTVGGVTVTDLRMACPPSTVNLGTWCMAASTFPVPAGDAGKNDFSYANQQCATLGGFLPTAAELIGAANRVKLNSYLTDNPVTANIDVDPVDGISDKREMSATLITTQGGATSAGALGVSTGSRGNPNSGEPNPVVVPAVPAPDTLQYVTVVDNGDHGGFAGSKPIGQTESFRCGYAKQQGNPLHQGG